jgi:predicted amidophosphoribosyltransferase
MLTSEEKKCHFYHSIAENIDRGNLVSAGSLTMPLINCKECGKAFVTYSGRPICPSCEARLNAEYELVREYVKENPQVTLDKVSEDTGVSTDRIRKYVADGLLGQVNLNETIVLSCQICKKPITSGNYCVDCMAKLKKNLKPSDSRSDANGNKNRSVVLKYRNEK